ncbi:MAG: hypothetical protein KGL39_36270 [Patescibacteria group bacterium]|nr:hypothetical protein [Patescibacteria group bacterium]
MNKPRHSSRLNGWLMLAFGLLLTLLCCASCAAAPAATPAPLPVSATLITVDGEPVALIIVDDRGTTLIQPPEACAASTDCMTVLRGLAGQSELHTLAIKSTGTSI